MDIGFLKGTAFGEFLRQLSEADGKALEDKINSLEKQLARQELELRGTPLRIPTQRLRAFTAGLRSLERNSLLRMHEKDQALAA